MLAYMVLGCRFAFAPPVAPHMRLHASPRHRPFSRDRRGLLLGRCSV